MFDVGWGEMVLIGVVALIAIGPKELPGVLRMVGQWIGKARRMASEFQGQFQEALREAEMAEVKKEFDAATKAASDVATLNPVAALQREFEQSMAPDAPTPVPPPMRDDTGAVVEESAESPASTPAPAPAASDAAPVVEGKTS